jgi:hypothetical protein
MNPINAAKASNMRMDDDKLNRLLHLFADGKVALALSMSIYGCSLNNEQIEIDQANKVLTAMRCLYLENGCS